MVMLGNRHHLVQSGRVGIECKVNRPDSLAVSKNILRRSALVSWKPRKSSLNTLPLSLTDPTQFYSMRKVNSVDALPPATPTRSGLALVLPFVEIRLSYLVHIAQLFFL